MTGVTEAHVIAALHHRYNDQSFGARRYACASHVPSHAFGGYPIADFLAIDCWKGRDQWPMQGFEIKTSRSDWLRELRDPAKSQDWMRYCRRWWLVAPAGVLRDKAELPPGWGYLAVSSLYEPTNTVTLRAMHAAPRLPNPEPLPWMTTVAIARAIQKTATVLAAARPEGAPE